MTISDARLDELERIAEKATPGEWEAFEDSNEHLADCPPTMEWLVTATDPGDDFYEEIIDWGNRGRREDAEHIAAFDPPTVLALIAEVKRLRIFHDHEKGRGDELEAERDVLQAAVDRVKAIHTVYVKRTVSGGEYRLCDGCGSAWPCDTRAALEGDKR